MAGMYWSRKVSCMKKFKGLNQCFIYKALGSVNLEPDLPKPGTKSIAFLGSRTEPMGKVD